MDNDGQEGIRLSEAETTSLTTHRDPRRNTAEPRLDSAERELLAQWRAWREAPSTRPPWAEALRQRLSGPNRVHGMLLGGAIGEHFARECRGTGERTSALLFALEGLLRARADAPGEPVNHVLSGLQRWMHTRSVPWRDCVPDAAPSDAEGWLVGQRLLHGTSSDDPAMLTGLARIASGEWPQRNHADSASAVPLGALAALWHDDAEATADLARQLASLTHGHPHGHRPAGVLGIAVFRLLRGHSLAESLDDAVHEWAPNQLLNALRLGRNRPAGFLPARRQIEAMGAGRSGVEVLGVAIRAATAASDDFAAAIRIATEHSGDVATSAMVCGQLLGALHGPGVIPEDWLADLVPRPLVERMAEQAVTGFGAHPDQSGQQGEPMRTGLAESARAAEARGRFLGSVLGCAIGEALGSPIAANSWDEIRSRHGADGVSDYIPAGHPAGRLGSDTQLLLFSLEGMIRANVGRRSNGVDDPARHIQHAYQRWLHTQHLSWPRAAGEFLSATPEPDGWLVEQRALFQTRNPGRTMMRTLIAFAKGQQPMGTPEQPVSDSRGSAAITRAVPAALWSDDPAEVFRVGRNMGALTHGHPEAFLSAGALAFLISRLVHDQDLTSAAEDALDLLEEHSGQADVRARISNALRLARSGPATPETMRTSIGSGATAGEALGIGLYAALVTDGEFDRALPIAVNHSGDSATTGAICGSLTGAALGIDAIPRRWLSDLELYEVVERLAQDAVAEFGPRPPSHPDWFERYPAT